MKQKLFFMLLFILTWTTQLIGANLLLNGDMEAQGSWMVSYLSTDTGQYPQFSWNYTDQIPAGGQGGCLHVKGVTTSGNSQVAFYQAVNLSADSVYNFDALFKNLKLQRSWCEVFIGNAPNEGEDYSESLGKKIANYGSWDNPAAVAEGSFKLNAAACVAYAPAATGTYYFVIKMGATTWDAEQDTCEILLDNLTLSAARIAPVPAFKADVRFGFAPLSVHFTDQSSYATSWLWEFGDGETSTDQNPEHTYSVVGTYDVKLTATNEVGSNLTTSTAYIQVTPATTLTGGGILKNGDMEEIGVWGVDYLNSGSIHPVETWNYSTEKPNAGQGGCLLIESEGGSGNIQFALYQKLHLSADSVYVFDGAFRDLSVDLHNYWCEIYLGGQPIPGSDYTANDFDATLIAKLDGWNSGSYVAGLNGTFKLNAGTYQQFIPESTGDYYFVLKMGTYDGPAFKIAVDEFSLTPLRTKPYVAFTANNNVGFPDLKTVFSNSTKFAASYLWDFGDGSENSSLENPTHTYTTVGTYTVSLKATNEKGDSILSKTAFVKVNEKPALPAGEMLYGGNMENGNYWSTNKCNPADVSTFEWNYTADAPTGGSGGNLRIQTTGTGFNTAIYQEITLKANYTYLFDGFFKDIKGVSDFWCEGYIGTTVPADGVDYTTTQGTKIFGMDTWNGLQTQADVQISKKVTVSGFKPTADGTYYFVLKMGSNNSAAREILLDELTLKELLPVKADFYADPFEGLAPLTVNFTDLSENATTWAWDFGDGATSTEQNPVHIYTIGGTFTVKLTASNSGSSDTTIQTDLITVTPTAVSKVLDDSYTISCENHMIKISGVKHQVQLFDISGRSIQSVNLVGKFSSQPLNAGLYILSVDGMTVKIAVK